MNSHQKRLALRKRTKTSRPKTTVDSNLLFEKLVICEQMQKRGQISPSLGTVSRLSAINQLEEFYGNNPEDSSGFISERAGLIQGNFNSTGLETFACNSPQKCTPKKQKEVEFTQADQISELEDELEYSRTNISVYSGQKVQFQGSPVTISET